MKVTSDSSSCTSGATKELSKPINYRTLWVLTGKEQLSLNKSFGTVKHLEKEKGDGYTLMDGLQDMKDNLHDWAR